MRAPNARDFEVVVPDVGRFKFGWRVMADEMRIQAEYARIVDGTTPTDWLHVLAGWMSTLKVLTVEAPAGWDLEQMDPLDDEVYLKLQKVFDALRDKELSFRGKSRNAGAQGGAGSVVNDGVLVPPQVQPAAD